MFKMDGTIQGRIFRILFVVAFAVMSLTGVSLYTIVSVKDSYQRANQELNLSHESLLNLRVALEQTAAGSEKARAQFMEQSSAMEQRFSNRSWSTELAQIHDHFGATEKMPREAAQVVYGDLRLELEKMRSAISGEMELQLVTVLDSLSWLIWPAAIFTLLIPAALLFLASRAINHDLTGFASSLNHFSQQNDETSESLRDASVELSGASSEQSAAVQQTVASIAEIRSMLAQTSNHVREVQALTTTVNDKTNDGSRTMSRMESAMIAIDQANAQLKSFEEIIQSIREKTQVINDIVFKTQLLSFNASIEAARAGQYGRGFAVVAEEVGKLAQLSGTASKEIDQLLADSQRRVIQIVEAVKDRVSDGKEVSGEAMARFGEIAHQIATIAEKVNQVGEATQEQEGGVEQTARAMDQMDSTALESKKAADQILKVAERVRVLSSSIREVTGGIQSYVQKDNSRKVLRPRPKTKAHAAQVKAAPGGEGGVADLVQRLASKRTTNAKPADFNADDPSFRKTGE
jgi:hypothetical protein